MQWHTGPTPTNTPVHGAHSTPGMHYTPALSSFPNALTAEFWLTRAKAREDEGDILVRSHLLPMFSMTLTYMQVSFHTSTRGLAVIVMAAPCNGVWSKQDAEAQGYSVCSCSFAMLVAEAVPGLKRKVFIASASPSWLHEGSLSSMSCACMQGALGVLENAIRRNARPFSPLTKAISRLQAAAGMQEPRAAAARPALWSSLRPNAADKQKKKTLRFAGEADEDIVAADDGQACASAKHSTQPSRTFLCQL